MHHIQQHKRAQHHRAIENILKSLFARDPRIDALRVFDEAEDDADGDEGEGAVEGVEEAEDAGLLGGGEVAFHFRLEAGGEVDEDEDEELLEADAAHVDVEAALDLGGGEVASGGHGGAGGLDDEGAGRLLDIQGLGGM